MKILKTILKIISISLAIIILIPILLYIFVAVGNNIVANNSEKLLISLPLPENTQFVDSISNAGKIVGNGNGMQYYSAIVVSSDMTEEELTEYYSSQLNYLQVIKLDDNKFFKDYGHTVFCGISEKEIKNFDFEKDNYLIQYWGYEMPDWFKAIHEFDLRGH